MSLGRREVIRLGGATAVGVVTGGCASLTDSTDSGPTDLSIVPADATALARIDGVAALSDDGVARILAAGLTPLVQLEGAPTQSEGRGLFDAVAARTGLDLHAVDTVVGFGTYTAEDRYAGVRIRADWSTDAVLTAVERLEPGGTRGRYRDRPVYTVAGGPWLGVLETEDYVLGTGPAVRGAIDVATGNREAVGGDLRRRYNGIQSGPFSAVASVPDVDRLLPPEVGGTIDPGQFVGLTHVTVEARTAGEHVHLVVRLLAASESDAEDLTAAVDGSLAAATAIVREEPLRAALAAISVEQRGSRVVLGASLPPAAAARVARALAERIRVLTGPLHIPTTPRTPDSHA